MEDRRDSQFRSVGVELFCSTDNNDKVFFEPDDVEKFFLKLRLNIDSVETICQKHKKTYLVSYSSNQGWCCDPLNQHKNRVPSKDLREITVSTAKKHSLALKLIPGKSGALLAESRSN